jgi:hypothetical protein
MRFRCISVLILLAAAVCVFAVPRADAPETTFNEADAPVNLAPPVLPGIRLILPTVDPVSILPRPADYYQTCALNHLVVKTAPTPRQNHRHSLQSLLCTLII